MLTIFIRPKGASSSYTPSPGAFDRPNISFFDDATVSYTVWDSNIKGIYGEMYVFNGGAVKSPESSCAANEVF